MLEQLSAQRELDKKKDKESMKISSEKTLEKSSTSTSSTFIKELEEKYQDQLRYLNSEKTHAEYQVGELKAKISSL
mgnify:CR=1 FL=1|jgi:hypothetical protein